MLKYIIIIYIILVIIEVTIFYTLNKYKNYFLQSKQGVKHTQYNTDHEGLLMDVFKKEISRRLKLADTMKYEDWIQYNQDNSKFIYEDEDYYAFIYEKSGHNFILRSSYDYALQDLEYSVERDLVKNKYLVLDIFPPPANLPQLMYDMHMNEDGFNYIGYNWENVFVNQPEKKETVFTKFHEKGFDGLIGIGYSIFDLSSRYGDFLFNAVNIIEIVFMNIMILFITIILFLVNKDNNISLIQSLVILFISWGFLVYQLITTTTVTNLAIENEKLQIISQNILGISFLVGVNVFIINSLQETTKTLKKAATIIRKEVLFLFSIVIIFLLLSLTKFNNFTNNIQLRDLRIQNQLHFNFAVFYNFIICCLFLIFLFKNYGFFKIKLSNPFDFSHITKLFSSFSTFKKG
jgi:hypothetical protein